MPSPTLRLRTVNEFGEDTIGSIVQKSVLSFLDWALLNIGGFSNIEFAESGAYNPVNVPLSRMRLSEAEGFTLGQIWEGVRKNWVWESGIDYTTQPIEITGIYVDDIFYPSDTTGTYQHSINYPLGRVEFDNPIPTDSTVDVAFSYKFVSLDVPDAPWVRELAMHTFRMDDESYTNTASGIRTVLNEHRIQLPSVIVEVTPFRQFKPYELGSSQQWCSLGIQFTIISENPWHRRTLTDILTNQNDMTIMGLNFNQIREDGNFPLQNGQIWSGTKVYPDLIEMYPSKQIIFEGLTGYAREAPPGLYMAVVRGICRTLF